MKNHFLAALFLLALIATVNACTVTGPTSGNTGQALTFTLALVPGEINPSIVCGSGGTLGSATQTAFICTYSTTGSKIVSVSVTSGEGSSSCTATLTISLATNQPPSVSITAPSSGAPITSGAPYSISGTASDSDGSVSVVEVQIGTEAGCGDGSWKTATGTTSWGYSWTPPSGKIGCVIRARAKDNASVESQAASVTFSTSGTQAGGNQSQPQNTCTPSCNAKQKTTCVNNAPTTQQVQCCAVSECTDTCVDGKYRQATACTAENTCQYGTAAYTKGKCDFNPACQVARPSKVTTNTPLPITVKYQGFTDPANPAPNSISVNCGNGQTATATNCGGASGSCATTCTYTAAGNVAPQATVTGVTCTSETITLETNNTQTQQNQTTTQTTTDDDETQDTNKKPTCSLTSKGTTATGERTEITIQYANLVIKPGLVKVQCGNDKDVVAPGCDMDVFGKGQCKTSCTYSEAGTYTATAVIQGNTCTTTINALQGETQPGEQTQQPILTLESQEANITVSNFATSPQVILEDAETSITALVKSDQPITSATCTPLDNQQSSCSCELSTVSDTSAIATCQVQPPVNGKYQITFTAQDGKTKTAEVTLTPGQTGKIEVVNKPADNTMYLAITAVILLLAYGAYYAYNKITGKLASSEKLYKKREETLKEIEFIKASYMKGELGKEQFQKMYNDKQEQLTEINMKIAEMGKRK